VTGRKAPKSGLRLKAPITLEAFLLFDRAEAIAPSLPSLSVEDPACKDSMAIAGLW
jgi:hypothetical protein